MSYASLFIYIFLYLLWLCVYSFACVTHNSSKNAFCQSHTCVCLCEIESLFHFVFMLLDQTLI